jgi:hypothetical protein
MKAPFFWKIGSAILLSSIGLLFFLTPARLDTCLKEAGRVQQCLNERVTDQAEEGDILEALSLLAEAYLLDSEFARNCHGAAHEIGKIAYVHFEQGKKSILTPLASYCGYGFYHGFMEEFLLAGGGADDARIFCKKAGEDLSEKNPDAEGACYHGIGHGAVDGTDPRAWGDPRAMLAGGLSLCSQVTRGLADIPAGKGPYYRCVSGAYNALEILSREQKYGLSRVFEHPFDFCSDEPSVNHEACYTNMLPLLLSSHQNDLLAIAKEIEKLPTTQNNKEWVTASLFHEFTRLHVVEDANARERGVALCRQVASSLRLPCIGGLSGGELKYGQPKLEYEGVLQLCGLESLTDEERDVCYHYGLSRLPNLYSPAEIALVCSKVSLPYQKFCTHD